MWKRFHSPTQLWNLLTWSVSYITIAPISSGDVTLPSVLFTPNFHFHYYRCCLLWELVSALCHRALVTYLLQFIVKFVDAWVACGLVLMYFGICSFVLLFYSRLQFFPPDVWTKSHSSKQFNWWAVSVLTNPSTTQMCIGCYHRGWKRRWFTDHPCHFRYHDFFIRIIG